TLLNALAGTMLHALALFRRLMAAQLFNVVLTVLFMTVLWLVNRLDVSMALLVGGATAGAAALLTLALLPADWRRSIHVWPGKQGDTFGSDGRTLLSFSRWMWLSNIFTILAVQVDVLLLNFFLPLPAVGIYALARNLAQKAESVNRTLHTVLAPGASGLTDSGQRREYAQRSLVRSLLLVGLMVLATPLARPFILLVYGQEYAASVNLFYALLLVVLVDLIISPLILLALPLDRPRLLALADGAQVIALLLVGLVAVPRLGAYGIILARLVGRLLAGLVALPPLLRAVRGAKVSPHSR
ncbi:MAG: lipopolysaccharide biosynthesis protein, partial [Chloroflexota bacterium]